MLEILELILTDSLVSGNTVPKNNLNLVRFLIKQKLMTPLLFNLRKLLIEIVKRFK